MLINFSEIAKERLKADMLWYVENGNCAISRMLIHTKPVCMVVANTTKSTVGLAQPQESEDPAQLVHQHEHPQEVQLAEGHQGEMSTQFTLAIHPNLPVLFRPVPHEIKTITLIEPVTQRLMPEMYEFAKAKRWLTKSKTDPMSKAPVIAIKVYDMDSAADIAEDDALARLTIFINSYLESLQEHIEKGNTSEVENWLNIWSELKQEHANITNLENLDLTLPNNKTITAHAHDCNQTALLQILQEKFGLEYIPTKYQSFMNFLSAVANVPDISDVMCAQLFDQHLRPHLQNTGEPFLRSPLFTLDTQEANVGQQHLNMYALQIACEENNLPAVKHLIRVGASLSPIDYSKRSSHSCASPADCELVIAIDKDNLEMFRALCPLSIKYNILAILGDAVHHAIHHDKPMFLRCLIEEFSTNQRLEIMLIACITHLAENCIDVLIDKYRSILENEADNIFSALSEIISGTISNNPKCERILCKLLQFSSSFLNGMHPAMFSNPSEEFNHDVHRARVTNDLVHNIINLRKTYIADGNMPNMEAELQELLCQRLYVSLYANNHLVMLIKQQQKLPALMDSLAMGNVQRGDFTKQHILKKIQNLVASKPGSTFRCTVM